MNTYLKRVRDANRQSTDFIRETHATFLFEGYSFYGCLENSKAMNLIYSEADALTVTENFAKATRVSLQGTRPGIFQGNINLGGMPQGYHVGIDGRVNTALTKMFASTRLLYDRMFFYEKFSNKLAYIAHGFAGALGEFSTFVATLQTTNDAARHLDPYIWKIPYHQRIYP